MRAIVLTAMSVSGGDLECRPVTTNFDNSFYGTYRTGSKAGSTLNWGEYGERRIYRLDSLKHAGRLMK